MQYTTHPLTDDELCVAPEHVRAWYLRVLTLMHFHGAAWDLAVATVADADAQPIDTTQSDQLVTPQRIQL